jgi:conjugal transfer pilus assembly protein TraU
MNAQSFAQAHDWRFNTWRIMGVMLDSMCVEANTSFDLFYITETDSMWNDEELGIVISPEALLFANPVSQLACSIDAMAAIASFPLEVMFWCMGSWGSAYPLTGQIYSANYVQANAGIAARLLYKLSRSIMLWDGANDLCEYQPVLLWEKDHFKMQIVRPVADSSKCFPIGTPGYLWTYNKNISYRTTDGNANDNFVWMIFSKRECCML